MGLKKKKSVKVKTKAKRTKAALKLTRVPRTKGVKKCPYVLYISEELKCAIKKAAKKEGMYLTDFGEALLSRGLHRN